MGGRDGTDDALPENTAVDVDQLRQAPAHQRMEMLRRMRGPNTSTATAEAGEAGEATADDHHRGARLALRLKDKFRVLTRQARHEQ